MLRARIDRLDQSDRGQAIVDYKTSRVPDTVTVTSGENIQLPFYALTLEHAVTQALFPKLSPTKVLDRVRIDGADGNMVITQKEIGCWHCKRRLKTQPPCRHGVMTRFVLIAIFRVYAGKRCGSKLTRNCSRLDHCQKKGDPAVAHVGFTNCPLSSARRPGKRGRGNRARHHTVMPVS